MIRGVKMARVYIRKIALGDDRIVEQFATLSGIREQISKLRSRYGSLLKEHNSLTQELELQEMSLKRLDGSSLNTETEERERQLQVRILTNDIEVWERTHDDYRKLPLEIAKLEEKERELESEERNQIL